MKKIFVTSVLSACMIAGSSFAGLADISFGSASAAGAGTFFGTDGNAADSISIGYFSGAANAELTGWSSFGTDSTFENAAIGFNTGFIDDADTTAGDGLQAWLLVSDGADYGLLRANDWVAITGADAPATPSILIYQLDSGDTAAGISTIGNILIADGGGAGGTGVSATITVVPEPSAFALLSGALALGWVMVRRRRA